MISPHICQTASGCVISNGKILLVKHRKLGVWLQPGGHIESGELPHQAAEREFFEETGVKAHVYPLDERVFPEAGAHGFVPTPFTSNLHWVCQENYTARCQSTTPEHLVSNKTWPKGCEQHFNAAFFLALDDEDAQLRPQESETTGIGWFTLEQISAWQNETFPSVRRELQYAFLLSSQQRTL